MTVTLTPQEFVNKWRGSTSTERQAYQQHFIDLCHLVGHPTPAELDPETSFSPSRPEPPSWAVAMALLMSGSKVTSLSNTRGLTGA